MRMYFDFRDVFKAPRIAFSFQRIWTNTLGIILAGIIYLIMSYLALMINGASFQEIFARSGFFPFPMGKSMSLLAWIVWGIGSILSGLVILVTNTAVARLVYMQLRNEFFYSWRQAFRFAFKKFLSIIGAYFTFIFMIAFFVVGALVMGIIGRIPAIGEWLNALLTIPYVLAGVLLAFIVLVTVVSILIIPAILATMDEDALGGVFQSFSIVYNQPWRLAIYSVLVGILELLAFAFYAGMLKVGYRVFALLFEVGMGEKFYRIAENSLAWLQHTLQPLEGALFTIWGTWTPYLYFSHPHATMALSGTETIAAVIVTFFLGLLGVSVVGFAEATGNAGMTLTFLALYKKQEDENLLEREDDELKEEEEEESEQQSRNDEEQAEVEKHEDETEASAATDENEEKEES